MFSSLIRDIRDGSRGLRGTPAFTSGAIVTVALAVGATTAVFSVVYGVLLRQLPYRHIEEVFWLWPGADRAGRPCAYRTFLPLTRVAVAGSLRSCRQVGWVK